MGEIGTLHPPWFTLGHFMTISYRSAEHKFIDFMVKGAWDGLLYFQHLVLPLLIGPSAVTLKRQVYIIKVNIQITPAFDLKKKKEKETFKCIDWNVPIMLQRKVLEKENSRDTVCGFKWDTFTIKFFVAYRALQFISLNENKHKIHYSSCKIIFRGRRNRKMINVSWLILKVSGVA